MGGPDADDMTTPSPAQRSAISARVQRSRMQERDLGTLVAFSRRAVILCVLVSLISPLDLATVHYRRLLAKTPTR